MFTVLRMTKVCVGFLTWSMPDIAGLGDDDVSRRKRGRSPSRGGRLRTCSKESKILHRTYTSWMLELP